MDKISAIVITRNAESILVDCLDTLSFCDEILVVDDRSTDRSVDLAKRMGAKVFSVNVESFADKRSFGLQKAKGPWILYIDADERISSELKQNILQTVKKPEFDAYKLRRKNFYFGGHEWPQIEYLERLFKKDHLKGWKGEVHETPIVAGEVGILDGYLLHYTHRDLSSMVEKTAEWSKIEAELRFKAHHPKMSWWRFFRVMFTAFYDSYIKQKGYKAGTAGLIESIYQAFSMFITYARLWEMQEYKK